MISILVNEITPRIEYTMYLIFDEVMGISHSLTTDPAQFQQSKSPRINYSKHKVADCITIVPTELLYQNSIVTIDIESAQWKELPTLFAHNKNDIPFDLFSAAFYLATRYEEYLAFNPDQYGRFEANQSIAYRNKFLHIPIIDLWCRELAKELDIYKECKSLQHEKYAFTLTIDIDHAWMIKSRGLFRNASILVRDLLLFRFREFSYKYQVLLNKRSDPGDSYTLLENVQKKLSHAIRYFILSGGNHKFDSNISIHNRKFRELIRNLNKNKTVGIHPSFASNNSDEMLNKEINDLSEITGGAIHSSRQHYLMLRIPDTYKRLISRGITEDHTMGFGTQTGFRAGIARPYFFYDLQKEKQTSLRIFPFQVMDRTLLSYLNFTPERALKELKYYAEIIASVGGNFITLWHNTSLNDTYEWKGWRKVFEEMIAMNEKK